MVKRRWLRLQLLLDNNRQQQHPKTPRLERSPYNRLPNPYIRKQNIRWFIFRCTFILYWSMPINYYLWEIERRAKRERDYVNLWRLIVYKERFIDCYDWCWGLGWWVAVTSYGIFCNIFKMIVKKIENSLEFVFLHSYIINNKNILMGGCVSSAKIP